MKSVYHPGTILTIASSVAMSLAMNVTLFTFTVMALAVGSLDNAGCPNPMTAVTMSIPITHEAWQHAHNEADKRFFWYLYLEFKLYDVVITRKSGLFSWCCDIEIH